MKRRSIVFRSPYDAVIEEDEIRDPGPREVLIESLYTLLSTGTEMTGYKGDFPPSSAWARMNTYPFSPGYSNVARVLAAGDEVASPLPDDMVFSWACHTSHAILDQEKVTKIPTGIEPKQAVFGTLAQIALNGVRLGGIELGNCVIIAGVGPVGQLSLQCARLSGACPLVAIDLLPRRLAIAEGHGADFTINPDQQDPAKTIAEITKNRMADVVYDVTGSPGYSPKGLKLLKKRGKLVILGSPRGPVEIDFHNEVHTMGLRIIGAHNVMHTPVETPYNQWTLARDLELFFEMVATGRISVTDLISHVYHWQDAPKAYEMLLQDLGETMCVVFDWKGEAA